MKTWLKGGLIGLGIVIFIIISIFVQQIVVRSLVKSGDFGEWHECANSLSSRWTRKNGSHYFDNKLIATADVENFGQIMEQKKIEICGKIPPMPYQNLRKMSNELEHLFLKGDIARFIPIPLLGFTFVDTPILFIILGFVIGAIIGLIIQIIQKVKKK